MPVDPPAVALDAAELEGALAPPAEADAFAAGVVGGSAGWAGVSAGWVGVSADWAAATGAAAVAASAAAGARQSSPSDR